MLRLITKLLLTPLVFATGLVIGLITGALAPFVSTIAFWKR